VSAEARNSEMDGEGLRAAELKLRVRAPANKTLQST
jgi:hypothetical protein